MRRLLPLIAALAPLSLAAQVLGMPVVNSGVPVGFEVGADVGFPNADAGGGRAIGARAGAGLGFVGVGAAVSRFSPDGDGEAVTSLGGTASLALFGGPLIPFRVMLQLGVARWTHDATSIEGDVFESTTTHVPLSLGVAATIPGVVMSIRPWIAPRLDVLAVETEVGTDYQTHPAVSGGIDLTLLSGLQFRAAYDRVMKPGGSPSIVSVGIGLAR